MKKTKWTQKSKVVAYLYTKRGEWVSAWECVGPKSTAFGEFFLSYKAPARLSEIYAELSPARFIERRKEYKNGATYYSYRLDPKIDGSLI